MGRPRLHPIPDKAADAAQQNDAEASQTDDDESNDDTDFNKILGNLTAKGGSGVDANMILIMQMMDRSNRDAERQRREEKESRRHTMSMMITLLTPLLPILVEKIFNKKSDPLMEKLLEGTLNKSNNTEMLKEFMEFMVTGNQTTLNNAIQQLTTVSEIKGKILEEELDKARNRDDDGEDSGKTSHPVIEGMREVRLLMDSMGRKSAPDNLNARGPGLDDPTPGRIAAPDAPAKIPTAQKPTPVAIFLRTLMSVHTNGSKMTPAVRAKIRTGLCMAILDDDALSKAIMEGDRDALMEMGTPIVKADPEVLNWIIKPGVEEWILAYISKQLGPALDEIINAEKYAEQPDEDDKTPAETTPAIPSDAELQQ